MAELISVTADLQHGRVIFRHSDDTEKEVSLQGFVAGARVKVDGGEVDKAFSARQARAVATVNAIPDERARALGLLELKSEEVKRKLQRAAENEVDARGREEVGKINHAAYMVMVAGLCKQMREGAALGV